MTLALHLSRAVLARILWVAAALTGLAVALDLVEAAGEVLAREDGGLVRYLGLRAPSILAAVLPVALILGPALAFLSLAGRNEFVALRAAGMTIWRAAWLLLPLAIVLGIGFHLLVDRAAPTLEGRLLAWLEPRPAGFAGGFWARTATGIVRADASSPEGDLILRADIYEMDEAGRLTARIDAEEARHAGGVWRFGAATRLVPGAPRSTPIDGAVWETTLRPANVRALATPARSVAVDVAERILSGGWSGNRTQDFYRVRVYRGYAAFVAPFLMILLALPASFGMARSGGFGRRAAGAVAVGFGFLLFDGMLTALGETGNLPPLLAAFGATAIFASVGLWTLVTLEE